MVFFKGFSLNEFLSGRIHILFAQMHEALGGSVMITNKQTNKLFSFLPEELPSLLVVLYCFDGSFVAGAARHCP
jgi:hypothetical protein